MLPYHRKLLMAAGGVPVKEWDILGATLVTSITLTSITYVYDMDFSVDGTKMYICGTSTGSPDQMLVHQYTLSTPFDVSTATYDSVALNVTGSISGTTYGIKISDDGYYLYILANNGYAHQYTLSTAWDISTATYDGVSFTPSETSVDLYDVQVSPTGEKLFTTKYFDSSIHQYALTTPFDISTTVYEGSISLVGNGRGSVFSRDGAYFYTMINGDYVYQYNTNI